MACCELLEEWHNTRSRFFGLCLNRCLIEAIMFSIFSLFGLAHQVVILQMAHTTKYMIVVLSHDRVSPVADRFISTKIHKSVHRERCLGPTVALRSIATTISHPGHRGWRPVFAFQCLRFGWNFIPSKTMSLQNQANLPSFNHPFINYHQFLLKKYSNKILLPLQ